MSLEKYGGLVSQPRTRARTVLVSYGTKEIYFFTMLITVMIITIVNGVAFLIHDATVEYNGNEAARPQEHQQPPREQAANSTLGFQQILAVSTAPSWRTHGLEAAANLTGLNITVPPQPPNPDTLVEAFQQIGAGMAAEQPKYGSAKAWMAHLDILKFVIASQLETTFIVEDDIDWDLAIKDQMRLVSDSVRAYNFVPSGDITPYGSDWDVLWLGHCGAMVGSNDTGKEPLLYPDDTRIDIEEYSGWSRPYIREGIPAGHRLVQDIPLAVCSFGYGVTKSSAPKVLNLLAKGAGEAFDIMLSSYCRSHQLNCLLVNPQIFNHYEPPRSDGYVSQVNGGNGQREGAEATAFENKKGFTGNIVNSSRCAALFGEQCVRPGSDLL